MGLRVGLFGTGHWASETHGAALAGHQDVELVGVWGRDPARTAALADRWAARPYAYVDALLSDVDAVAIAVAPDVQAELAARAAESGRHLLLDKPLALTVAAADRIVRGVEQHRLASLVFFTGRYSPNVAGFLAEARDVAWDGARATMLASVFQPGNPYGLSEWRRTAGGLWDVGPHALAVILPVLGPVAEVAAMTGPRNTTHVLLKHLNGAASTLSLTLDAPPAAVVKEVVLFGEPGQVRVPTGELPPVVAFRAAVDQLIAAIDTGHRQHPCDVRFGRDVVAVLAAAQEAAGAGRTVRLDSV
jgi:predicted dehydrogenase